MKRYAVVHVIHGDGERIPMVVRKDSGFPVDVVLEYLLARFRGYSPNTIRNAALDIALALEWGDRIFKQDGLIGALLANPGLSPIQVNSLSEFLRKSFKFAGTLTTSIVCPEHHYIRLFRTKEFCDHVMANALCRIPLSDPRSFVMAEIIAQMRKTFEDHLPAKPIPTAVIKSLNSNQSTHLLEVVQATHPANPFTEWPTRIRNRSIVELMLYTGLRPGEVRGLRIEDVKFGSPTEIRIVRRPHAADDRRESPGLVKRKGRILPLEHKGAAGHLREYIQDVKPVLEAKNAQQTPFVFLGIDTGLPISSRAIEKVFAALRKPLSEKPAALEDMNPAMVTPMTMRHTFSNDTEEDLVLQGIDEEGRRPMLMQLRGDTSARSVDPYIERTRQKQAKKHLASRQKALFDGESGSNEDVPY